VASQLGRLKNYCLITPRTENVRNLSVSTFMACSVQIDVLYPTEGLIDQVNFLKNKGHQTNNTLKYSYCLEKTSLATVPCEPGPKVSSVK
jgi:hypothetical protein